MNTSQKINESFPKIKLNNWYKHTKFADFRKCDPSSVQSARYSDNVGGALER